MSELIVRVEGLTRVFRSGGQDVRALQDVSINVPHGVLYAVMGRSGSGKTTLLNLIGGLDRPTKGSIYFEDEKLSELPEGRLTELRRHKIGFVFQSFGLLPLLTAYENVELPLRIGNVPGRERARRAREALETVGLGPRMRHRPYELSGGEQQRVAIARALVSRPSLILADEPTGELDTETGATILSLFQEIVRQEKITVLTATHDRSIRDYTAYIQRLSDGRLVEDTEAVAEAQMAAPEPPRSPFARPRG
ncbi:MAG: ABC transporter ATP-binding protein [Chloroflexi bacterium]|nr:ABC transporter ATP-binding protein [Chloroflexota bacterium]